jgi:Rne/Rng family ribonuclease
MSKELYVSSTPHQTKVALVENDQLAEVYFERENEYTLAGSIYKGRVTRVLPGMQSAFVDIGLERDAFLYVSDFFELEDEDETFDPIPAAAAKPFQAQPEPRPEPVVLTSPEEEGEEPEAAAHEATGTNGAAEGTREDDGNRRWRGRNRRRRGRRGFPENKFAHPEHQQGGNEGESEEAEDEAQAPHAPIVLPGESLAKFNRRREEPVDTEAAEVHEPVDDVAAEGGEPSGDVVPEVAAAPEAPIRREQPKSYEPIILPGESLAKYNRNRQKTEEEPSAAKEEPAAAERKPAPRVRESRREEYRPYEPIVLPGESISKYRNRPVAAAPPPVVSEETAEENAEAAESVAAEARVEAAEENGSIAAPVEHVAAAEAPGAEMKPEALNWWQEADAKEPEPETQEAEYEQEQHVESASGAVEAEPEQALEERAEVHESEPEREPEQARPSRFGRMKAFIFGEEEPTQAQEEPTQHAEPRAESAVEAEEHHPEEQSASAAISFEGGHESEVHADFEGGHEAEVSEAAQVTERPEPDYRNAPLGAFEEEVIEGDEEEDIPHPSEVLYEPDSYEEMEEETLERAAMAADDIVDELEEDETNGYATEEESGEEAEAESAEEPELAARAETRGPSGTAGFQRAPRPEYDRNHRRGRRGGGRRMQRGGPRREQSRPTVMISDVLKEGQEVLVQIAKEPIGKKGARITSHIALPGRFLVYMPSVNHTGVSRKIASDEERQRLKRIVNSERENGHGGFIVRTAAAGIAEDELRADIRFLKSLWNDIKSRADSSKPPALIYHDLNLVERTLRDLVTEDFSAIWVDTEPEYERVVRFVNRFQPSLTRRVKLYSKDTPLFEQFGVEEEINKGLRSKVWLKSGGYIVINQTEALVAIDINTGKYVGKTTRLEDTIFKTNLDAIKEIVRQIRLRDLGGIIVIDFIDMDERRNRQKIMQALEEELQNDRAPSKVLQFNDFGLVAITRKRVKQSLERTLGSPCPYCSANGYVKSPQTVCNEIYTEMRKMARHFEHDITLRVNPEVAKELKANNGKWLSEMEELTTHNILVKADPTLHQEQFDM